MSVGGREKDNTIFLMAELIIYRRRSGAGPTVLRKSSSIIWVELNGSALDRVGIELGIGIERGCFGEAFSCEKQNLNKSLSGNIDFIFQQIHLCFFMLFYIRSSVINRARGWSCPSNNCDFVFCTICEELVSMGS